MNKVTSGEELRQRMVQAAGEDVMAWGWGTLGMGNVLAAVTASALVLEFVTFTLKTKKLLRIPFEDLEFIYPSKGNATAPGLLKMNVQAQVDEALTGTLIMKPVTGELMYITFRKMPRHDKNDRAPFRIAEFVSSVRPDKVFLPDLSSYSQKRGFAGCFRSFLLIAAITSVVLALILGLLTGEWDLGLYAGIGTGVVLGAAFAPLIPHFKRMLSGRG